MPFPSPGALPDPGIEPMPPTLAGVFFTTEPPGKPEILLYLIVLFHYYLLFMSHDVCFSFMMVVENFFQKLLASVKEVSGYNQHISDQWKRWPGMWRMLGRTPRNPRRQALQPCIVLTSPDQVPTLGDSPNPRSLRAWGSCPMVRRQPPPEQK